MTRLLSISATAALGILLLDLLFLNLLDFFEKIRLADLLFIKGAVLMVVGGMRDMSRSLTLSKVRDLLHRKSVHAPPDPHTASRGAALLLFTGVFLCLLAFAALLTNAG